MAEKQKTIADIIAEMRCGLDKSWHEIDREWTRDLPDRLEAALKREKAATEADALAVGGIVEAARKGELSKTRPKNAADFGQFGNAAAMRDVLVDVYNTLEKLQPYALQINDISLRRGFRGRLCHAKNVIDTALAAPPRNCDVGLAREQTFRHSEYCKKSSMGKGCSQCPLRDTLDCRFDWAQLPYEKGEDDGGK